MTKHSNRDNWTLVAIANDFHVPFHDRKALKLFLRLLKDERPEWLVLAGDFQDFWEISSFDKTPRPEAGFAVEIEAGRKILKAIRRALPKARITWLEGNHEHRLVRYLVKHAPELHGLPGLSVPELFGLAELGIEYKACEPQAAKFTDNFVRIGKLYAGHWDRVARHGGYTAKGLVSEKGVSLLQGHTHRFGAHARTTVDGRVLLGIENLSMCSRSATYANRPNWQLGFSLVHLEPRSGRFQWHPILIGRQGFVWNDRVYAVKKRRTTVRQLKRAA